MSVSLNSNAIITLDYFKAYVNLPDVASDNDDTLTTWINDESDRIEGIGGINNKVVAQEIDNEIWDGNGRSHVRLNFYPIISLGPKDADTAAQLAALQVRDDVASTWGPIETDLRYILLHNPNVGFLTQQTFYAIELLRTKFPHGVQNMMLSAYMAGWSSVPADLTLVCLERVMDRYKQSPLGGGRFGIKTVSSNVAGQSNSTSYMDFSSRHKEIMAPYRRRFV